MPKGSWSLLVCAILTMACREEQSKAPGGDSSSVAASDTSGIAFSAPEVRRLHPDSLNDSTPAAKAPDSSRSVAPSAQVEKPPVVVSAPPVVPVPAPTAPVAAVGAQMPGPNGDFVVQIDIHKSESDALKAIQKLATRGIPAYIVPAAAEAGLSGSYWRVRVGRFVSRADAQAYGETVLKPAGLKYWIDRKANEPAVGGGQG
jgi:cell division septation protein DedD